MAQVIRPRTPQGDLAPALGIAGAVAGGIYGGGLPGAAAGAGIGSSVGTMLEPQQAQQQSLDSGSSELDAMKRKQQQMQQDNLETLKQAEANLPSLPEDLRQQYAPAIMQARMLEEKKRGMA